MHTINCTIYCSVIDNFGDIGVCWRLAQQLSNEYAANLGMSVTLWVDDLDSFAMFEPRLDRRLSEQYINNILIKTWHNDNAYDATQQHDIIIEGFACRIPEPLIDVLAAQTVAPLWINLEYLSAETWTQSCHLQSSTHPRTGLQQYFWFPSFTMQGGLLRERQILTERDLWQQSQTLEATYWQQLGIPTTLIHRRKITLFSYANPHIASLLTTLAADQHPSLLLVPEGKALANVTQWLASVDPLVAGQTYHRGALSIHVLGFLHPKDYDRLLWLADLNIVRGEDSFVRAQWAAKPFLWHIYPQDDDAHIVKLEAFLAAHTAVIADNTAQISWQQVMRQWNTPTLQTIDWQSVLQHLPAWQAHCLSWTDYLAQLLDLCEQLMRFYLSEKHSSKSIHNRL